MATVSSMAGAMKAPAKPKPMLRTEASAQLRDRLIAEVRELGSSDDAATWAHKIFAEKNTLIAEDAQVLEGTFQARLEAIGVDPSKAAARNLAPPTPREPNELAAKPKSSKRSQAIDKSVLAMPEPRRVRDRGSCQISRPTSLPDLRPAADGCASSQLRPKHGTRP